MLVVIICANEKEAEDSPEQDVLLHLIPFRPPNINYFPPDFVIINSSSSLNEKTSDRYCSNAGVVLSLLLDNTPVGYPEVFRSRLEEWQQRNNT